MTMKVKAFRQCIFLIDELLSCYDCIEFIEPVPEEAIIYHGEIKNPMDFITLEQKLFCNKYKSYQEFRQDLELIWTNATNFHRDFDEIYKEAVRLKKRFLALETYLTEEKSTLKFTSLPVNKEFTCPTTEENWNGSSSILPKSKLYFIQTIPQDAGPSRKYRGYNNVITKFNQLNLPFLKRLDDINLNLPFPRFYLSQGQDLLRKAIQDPDGLIAIILNVQLEPVLGISENHLNFTSTVAIVQPVGEVHSFDRGSLGNQKYDNPPGSWVKFDVVRIIKHMKTVISNEMDRALLRAFYKVLCVSTDQADLDKTSNPKLYRDFARAIIDHPLNEEVIQKVANGSHQISTPLPSEPRKPDTFLADPKDVPEKKDEAALLVGGLLSTDNGYYTELSPNSISKPLYNLPYNYLWPTIETRTNQQWPNTYLSNYGAPNRPQYPALQESIFMQAPERYPVIKNENSYCRPPTGSQQLSPGESFVQNQMQGYPYIPNFHRMSYPYGLQVNGFPGYPPYPYQQNYRELPFLQNPTFWKQVDRAPPAKKETNIPSEDVPCNVSIETQTELYQSRSKLLFGELLDFSKKVTVPVKDIQSYYFDIKASPNAEGYFKQVYFLQDNKHKVVQTFRRMTTAQRVTEIASLLKLKNMPHIGQITEVIEEKGEIIGLSMERYQKTLKQYAHAHSHHRLTAYQKMDLVVQLLECMKTIHDHGLAHRDLSEVNFMVNETAEELPDGSFKANVYLIDFGKSTFVFPDDVHRWWIQLPPGETECSDIVPTTKEELAEWCEQLPWMRAKPDHGYRLYRSIQTMPKSRVDTQELSWLINPLAEDVYSIGTIIWKIFSETEPWYGILETDIKSLRDIVSDDYNIEKALEREVPGELSKQLLLFSLKVAPQERKTAGEILEWISNPKIQSELVKEWESYAPVDRQKRHAKRFKDEPIAVKRQRTGRLRKSKTLAILPS